MGFCCRMYPFAKRGLMWNTLEILGDRDSGGVVTHTVHKRWVAGSSPAPGTRSKRSEVPSAEAVPAYPGSSPGAAPNDAICEIVSHIASEAVPDAPTPQVHPQL